MGSAWREGLPVEQSPALAQEALHRSVTRGAARAKRVAFAVGKRGTRYARAACGARHLDAVPSLLLQAAVVHPEPDAVEPALDDLLLTRRSGRRRWGAHLVHRRLTTGTVRLSHHPCGQIFERLCKLDRNCWPSQLSSLEALHIGAQQLRRFAAACGTWSLTRRIGRVVRTEHRGGRDEGSGSLRVGMSVVNRKGPRLARPASHDCQVHPTVSMRCLCMQ